MQTKRTDKPCRICREIFPIDEFGMRGGARGPRRRDECRKCRNWLRNETRKRNGRPADDPRPRLLRKYGLTPEAHDALLEAQGHACAICGAERSEDGRRLAVDHCHDTGMVRGLLCTRCNTGIGSFRDDLELMRRAITYLTR